MNTFSTSEDLNSQLAIEAIGVCKNYGLTEALAGLDVKVKNNTIFTLLGPNGAGKTTFIKSLLGLVKFQSGTIKIFGGSSLLEDSRSQLGYLPEKFYFYPYYTVESTISFFIQLNGGHDKNDQSKIHRVAELVGLKDLLKRQLSTLSKGQLQRVGVASLLVGQKKLLLLDEPFSGLDPLGMKDLKDLILKLKNEEGKTIFINSHILSEMEKIADDFAIIDKGKCLAQDTIRSLPGGESLEDYFTRIVRGNSASMVQ